MVQAKNGYRSKTILTAFFTNFGLFHERMQPWDCGSNSSPQNKSKCLFVHCISFLLGNKNGHGGYPGIFPNPSMFSSPGLSSDFRCLGGMLRFSSWLRGDNGDGSGHLQWLGNAKMGCCWGGGWENSNGRTRRVLSEKLFRGRENGEDGEYNYQKVTVCGNWWKMLRAKLLKYAV